MTVMVQAKGHEASNARSLKETSCWSYWGGFSPSLRELIPFMLWSRSPRQEILYWGEGRGDGRFSLFPVSAMPLISWHSEVAIIYPTHLRLLRTLRNLVCNMDQLLCNIVLSWFHFWGCFCWLENLDKSLSYWSWIFTVENWQFRKMSEPSY